MQQRYYDPIAGRFLSVDPVVTDEETGGHFNRYVYGNNNPYRFIDPDGRASKEPSQQEFNIGGGRAGGDIGGGWAGVPSIARGTAAQANLAEARAATVQANNAKGNAFEAKVAAEKAQTNTDVARRVTIKTPDGSKTQMDILSKDASGKIVCTECKSSATAPFTPGQKAALPKIEQSGGVVVGAGKPGYPPGTAIPPQKVEVIRPSGSQ